MHEPHPTFAPFTSPPAEAATPRDVAREVVAMLQRPAPTLPPPRRPWLVLWRVIGLYFAGMLFAGALASAATQVVGAEHMLDKMRLAANTPGKRLFLLLMAGVVAPLWEEVAFRLPLAPFRAWRVLPALFLAALLLGSDALEALSKGRQPPPWAWWPFSVTGVLGLAVIATFGSPPWRAQVEAWWSRSFRLVLLALVFAFGFAHAVNFRFSNPSPLVYALVPLLVLPQIVAGVLLSYVRIKLGFWFAVLLHSGVNTVLMTSVFLAPLPPDKPKPRPGGQPPLAGRTPARPVAAPNPAGR